MLLLEITYSLGVMYFMCAVCTAESFIDEAEEEEMEGVPVNNGGAKNGAAANEALSMMECLPSEVLEDVFVWVPLIELFASCRLVSRRWNEVISREKVRVHSWYKCCQLY